MSTRSCHLLIAASMLSAIVASASFASAEPSREEKALADALFRDAKDLMAKKEYPAACRKLEESQRLDPGGGTLLALALCHEKEGKTSTAWSEFQEALTMARAAKRKDRERIAKSHISALEPKLSHLVVNVASPHDLTGFEIKLDGVTLGQGAWGSELPVDPGSHTISASATDYQPWSSDVTVEGNADKKTVSVPALVKIPPKPKPIAKPSEEPPKSSWPTSRTVGLILASVGVAGIGIGTYFGLRAFSKHDESQLGCSNGICNQAGWDAYQDGKTSAKISTGAFTAGGALFGVGAILFFASLGSDSSAKPADAKIPPIQVAAGAAPGNLQLIVRGAL